MRTTATSLGQPEVGGRLQPGSSSQASVSQPTQEQKGGDRPASPSTTLFFNQGLNERISEEPAWDSHTDRYLGPAHGTSVISPPHPIIY